MHEKGGCLKTRQRQIKRYSGRNRLNTVYDMPEPIISRCIGLGLVDETKRASGMALGVELFRLT